MGGGGSACEVGGATGVGPVGVRGSVHCEVGGMASANSSGLPYSNNMTSVHIITLNTECSCT